MAACMNRGPFWWVTLYHEPVTWGLILWPLSSGNPYELQTLLSSPGKDLGSDNTRAY